MLPWKGSSQGTCAKDPWTQTSWGVGQALNVVGEISRAGESNGEKMGISVIEQ